MKIDNMNWNESMVLVFHFVCHDSRLICVTAAVLTLEAIFFKFHFFHIAVAELYVVTFVLLSLTFKIVLE
jgi:bacteriorhodopsin